jgi:hypothetical protein
MKNIFITLLLSFTIGAIAQQNITKQILTKEEKITIYRNNAPLPSEKANKEVTYMNQLFSLSGTQQQSIYQASLAKHRRVFNARLKNWDDPASIKQLSQNANELFIESLDSILQTQQTRKWVYAQKLIRQRYTEQMLAEKRAREKTRNELDSLREVETKAAQLARLEAKQARMNENKNSASWEAEISSINTQIKDLIDAKIVKRMILDSLRLENDTINIKQVKQEIKVINTELETVRTNKAARIQAKRDAAEVRIAQTAANRAARLEEKVMLQQENREALKNNLRQQMIDRIERSELLLDSITSDVLSTL